MTREDVVERVARAIHGAQFEDEFPRAGTIEHALFCQCARAAIAELASSYAEWRTS